MKSNSIAMTILASVAMGALSGPAMAQSDCFTVKGKISNSWHDPALGSIYAGGELGIIGGVSTLGVVALNGEKPIGKMKCALAGVATGEGANGLPDFTHTISCDDKVEVIGGIVHSQLTFNTTGQLTGDVDVCGAGLYNLYFEETSVANPGSGRGVFYGVTGGALTIDGSISQCTGSIDMRFTGEVCY